MSLDFPARGNFGIPKHTVSGAGISIKAALSESNLITLIIDSSVMLLFIKVRVRRPSIAVAHARLQAEIRYTGTTTVTICGGAW